MQSSARAELRQFPRRCVGRSQLLTVDVVRETGSTQHGIVLNISEGGAALQLLGTPQGAGVSRMRLNFPAHDSPLESGAKLAWLAPGGRAGVQFSNLPPRTRDAIREWLRAQPVHELETSPDVGAVVANDLDEFGLTLGIIAERAMARTGAKGAAIAIGNRDFMVCCASIGNAPALHAPLRPDSGLSGICLRSGTDLYCLDAKSDGRIDPAVAEQLGMRSAALLPVTVSGNVVGILELFSDEPNQFGPATTRDRLGRLLQFLASAIAEYQPTDEANESVVENVVAAEVSPTVEPSAPVEPPPVEAPMQEEASDTDIRKLLDIATPQQTGGVPRTVIIVFVLLAVAAAGFWYFMQQSSAPANTLPSETTAAPADAVPPLVGLSPSAVTAKAGD
ncbi:MAG TPA: GAF domain-containing protein, partial [Terriglobales bacterium]